MLLLLINCHGNINITYLMLLIYVLPLELNIIVHYMKTWPKKLIIAYGFVFLSSVVSVLVFFFLSLFGTIWAYLRWCAIKPKQSITQLLYYFPLLCLSNGFYENFIWVYFYEIRQLFWLQYKTVGFILVRIKITE